MSAPPAATPLTPAEPSHRGSRRRSRRGGYAATIVVDLLLLVVVTSWPGWQQFGFLTPAAADVIPIFVTALWVGVGVNLLLLLADPRWLRGLTDMVTSAVGILVLARTWQVFPFTFADTVWGLLVRLVIVLGLVGCAIGIVAGFVRFLRGIVVAGGHRNTADD